jgi:hypothetical protein
MERACRRLGLFDEDEAYSALVSKRAHTASFRKVLERLGRLPCFAEAFAESLTEQKLFLCAGGPDMRQEALSSFLVSLARSSEEAAALIAASWDRQTVHNVIRNTRRSQKKVLMGSAEEVDLPPLVAGGGAGGAV